MMTNEQAQIAAKLSHASYGDAVVPAGYERVDIKKMTGIKLDDPDTGFHAEIYKKTGTNEYTVAFTGTQPNTSQDVVADLALGTKQWSVAKNYWS